MKNSALALALLIGVGTPAIAADTHSAWQGFLTVTATTAACAGIGGTAVGDTNVSIYRAGQSTTDITSISIIYTRAAINLQNLDEVNNRQMRGNGSAKVVAMNGKGKPFSYNTTYSDIITTPANILNGSPYATMTGTFYNMWNTNGCNLTFKATYNKQL